MASGKLRKQNELAKVGAEKQAKVVFKLTKHVVISTHWEASCGGTFHGKPATFVIRVSHLPGVDGQPSNYVRAEVQPTGGKELDKTILEHAIEPNTFEAMAPDFRPDLVRSIFEPGRGAEKRVNRVEPGSLDAKAFVEAMRMNVNRFHFSRPAPSDIPFYFDKKDWKQAQERWNAALAAMKKRYC